MENDKEKQFTNKEDKQLGEFSRRDFLISAGSVIVGGAIGFGIGYPFASSNIVVQTNVETLTITETNPSQRL
jgi:formylmethanofuran dehydrogenase subunit C